MSGTALATDRQAEPHRRCRLCAVCDILYAELFGHNAAFRASAMVPVKCGRDALIECRIGKKVARQLLDGELIEWHVVIERLDYPIAPAPHVADAVRLIAVGIAITCGFHPPKRHALAVTGRGEQAVHNFL